MEALPRQAVEAVLSGGRVKWGVVSGGVEWVLDGQESHSFLGKAHNSEKRIINPITISNYFCFGDGIFQRIK